MTRRLAALLVLIMCIMLLIIAMSLPTAAQNDNDDTATLIPRPIILTPGFPLSGTPITPPDVCFDPLPISAGQTIYIKSGVNIRNVPNVSGGLVWNTVYDNRTEDGTELASGLSIAAVVTDGPICMNGFNWWRVVGLGNPGWVAEGRPDIDSGYFIIVPELAPAPSCDSLYENGIGKTAELALNARVRDEPNTRARTATIAPAGTSVLILDGPECVNNTLWWFVQVTVVDFTYQGWMAEAQDGIFYLVPDDAPSLADGTICANPLSFFEGMRGYVNYPSGDSPKALRTAPDTDAPLLFNLVENVPFFVVGGPVCSDNLNWWRIRVLTSNTVVGWIAEGSPGVGYWLSELDPAEFGRVGQP